MVAARPCARPRRADVRTELLLTMASPTSCGRRRKTLRVSWPSCGWNGLQVQEGHGRRKSSRGQRYGPRERIFDAVIDSVDGSRLADFPARDRAPTANPEIRRTEELASCSRPLYNRAGDGGGPGQRRSGLSEILRPPTADAFGRQSQNYELVPGFRDRVPDSSGSRSGFRTFAFDGKLLSSSRRGVSRGRKPHPHRGDVGQSPLSPRSRFVEDPVHCPQ